MELLKVKIGLTIREMAHLWLQLAVHLPKFLWGEIVLSANYILIRTVPTKLRESFKELFFNNKNCFHHLQIFGTECFLWIPQQKPKKFNANLLEYILLVVLIVVIKLTFLK